MKKISLKLILCVLVLLSACSSRDRADVLINKNNQVCFSSSWQGEKDTFYLYDIAVSDPNQSSYSAMWNVSYGKMSEKPHVSTREMCMPYGAITEGAETIIPAQSIQTNKPYAVSMAMTAERMSANDRHFVAQFCLAKENSTLVVKQAEAIGGGQFACTKENFSIEYTWLHRLFGSPFK